MSRKPKNTRVCISCRTEKDKFEMIRLKKNQETNEIEINSNSKSHGRSVYICKNEECVTKAIKKCKIEHNLKAKMSENITKELYTVLKS